MPRKDLLNQRFERLEVIAFDSIGKHGQSRWLCRCDCGNTKVIDGRALTWGDSKSCGCLKKEIATAQLEAMSLSNIKHGHSRGNTKTSEYHAWHDAKGRVTNPKDKKWKSYGGRGITMSPEWLNDFEVFYKELGPKPGPGYSLDRINNEGNYEPGNCRWATAKEQANNRRARKLAGRPRKQLPLPEGFRRGGPVKVTTPEYKGVKLGLLIDVCKYKDDGFTVLLTGESSASQSVYVCIKPSEGDLLEVIDI